MVVLQCRCAGGFLGVPLQGEGAGVGRGKREAERCTEPGRRVGTAEYKA